VRLETFEGVIGKKRKRKTGIKDSTTKGNRPMIKKNAMSVLVKFIMCLFTY